MSQLAVTVLWSLAAVLAAMLFFMVGRRAWRALAFRRLDRWQRHWLRRLGPLLDGEIPALEALQRCEARESLESVLITRLQAADGSNRKRLMDLLDRCGLLDHHIAALRWGTPWQRHQSAALLGKMGSAAAVPALVEALDDKWSQVRTAALRSLGAIGCPAAGPAIIRFLRRGPPPEPAIWLDAAIACITDPNGFLPLFDDDRPQVRAQAARAIAESAATASFEALDSLVFDTDPEVRAQVVRAMGRASARASRVLPLLIAATHDEKWFVRLRAVAALGTLGLAEGADAVLRATADPNFSVRRQAAASLAKLATRPSEVLQALAGHHDRYAVESYLSQLARSGLLWRTVPLLCSPDDAVRCSAEELLIHALAAGHRQEVISAAETYPEGPVRKAAARLLEHAAATDRLLRDEAAPTVPEQ